VGETFACTLCANNELLPAAEPARQITGVRIEAEMKTPSSTYPLDVVLAPEFLPTTDTEEKGNEARTEQKGRDLDPGRSVQGIVEFHLKEEGSHVLAVTISYTENGRTSGRVRTFRKLYQFVARGCLIVRTKIGSLPGATVRSTTLEGNEQAQVRKRWALEAQLENSGDDLVVLESVSLEEKPWCKAMGLNWEKRVEGGEVGDMETPTLGPKDIQQICFLVEQVGDEAGEEDGTGRLIMGMLHISWRGAMGNRGSLSTNWLGTRFR
jgi:trafficking protein particle complex subunit 13